MTISPRFRDALSYVATLHAEQQRKLSGEPYLAHLLAVAAIVMEHGGNEDEAIAALLHDAVEDQGGLPTLDEIRQRFGATVAVIVEGCTDATVTPKPPWRARKEAYIAQLSSESGSVRLVSAADKLHNVRSILREYRRQGEAIWDSFRGGRDGTLWYYRTVVETLKQADSSRLLKKYGCHAHACRGHVNSPENMPTASVDMAPEIEIPLFQQAANPLVEELDRTVAELERMAHHEETE